MSKTATSGSQARFVGGVVLGMALFALGCSTLLFSATTDSLATGTDRALALAVSAALVVVGAALTRRSLS